jgi:formylglycine-generating enzyme required for sulfatase activity
MIRRLDLDISKDARQVKQSASAAAAPNASVAPATRPVEPGRPFLTRTIRVTRRQALGIAALAATGTGAIIAAPSIRRLLSKPPMRTIAFDVATVDAKGVRNPPEKHTAAVFTEELGSGGLDMVSIPGGSFTMGSPVDEPERLYNEGPQHRVILGAFFIGASPVTQAQWLAVVMAHPVRINRDLDPKPSFFRGIDLPVESVTWNQADEFCLRLTEVTGRAYRLPSEAEWEYACRAGTMSPFHFGPTIIPELANYCGTGGALCGESGPKHRLRCVRRRKVRFGRVRSGSARDLPRDNDSARNIPTEPVWSL